MASENTVTCIGDMTASADLSAKQYHFVKVSGVGTFTFAAANTDAAIGVLQDAPASGKAGSFAIAGVTKLVVGAGVTAGQKLMPNTAGRAIAATGTGAIPAAIALETATTDGQVIRALILPPTHLIP